MQTGFAIVITISTAPTKDTTNIINIYIYFKFGGSKL